MQFQEPLYTMLLGNIDHMLVSLSLIQQLSLSLLYKNKLLFWIISDLKTKSSRTIISQIGTLTIPCSICGKSFSAQRELNRHLLVHCKNMAFRCNHCSNVFKWPDSLRRHVLKVHPGRRSKWIITTVILWKYFHSLAPIFVVSLKCIDPWILEFVVSNITGNSQW